MGLEEFATNVAPTIQAVTSIIGMAGIILVWHQIRISNDWNRANTQHVMLSNMPSQELEKELWSLVTRLPTDAECRLTAEAPPIIYSDPISWVCVRTFLNKHEQLCAAINAKTVNDRYAYDVHGARVTDTFRIFESYISYARHVSKDVTIYLELERVATIWSLRAIEEKAAIARELAKLTAARGANSIIG